MRTLTLLILAASAHGQLVYEPAEPLPGLVGSTRDLQVGDVDGDGLTDVFIPGAVPGSALRIALADGDGGYVMTTLPPDLVSPAALVDVNSDGILDLVHATPSPQTMAVSLGAGDGTFLASSEIAPPPPSPGIQVQRLSIGDIDGDGTADVAFAQGQFLFGEARLFLGNGDATYTELEVLAAGAFVDVDLADVDGDGFDDAVIAADFGASWRRSLGDGTFAAPSPVADGEPHDILPSAQVEFFTREGTEIVLRALVDDVFAEVGRVTVPFEGDVSEITDVDDADGDGRPDFILAGRPIGQVLRQTEDGRFEPAAFFTATSDDLPLDLVAVDRPGGRDLWIAAFGSVIHRALDVTYGRDEPFSDLGGNTPGSVGFPTQVLEADGATLSVRVLAAAPSAPVYAIWGGSLGAPLGGSTASPSPDRVLGPFTTSPLGTLEVSASDALPLGLDVYAQWWIVDEGGALASTSTVRITDA